MVKRAFPFLLILLFSLLAGFSLLHRGLPPTHDGEYHIIRFYEFDKTLRAGQLYPRWQSDLNSGYGSPLLNYYYPLPNYAASLIHAFGASFIDSFKIEMFIATILGAVFFFLWVKSFWGTVAGVTSAVFYLFSPYHFVDIYVRGSVGEVWALAFFPGFLWCVTKVLRSKNALFVMPSALLLSLTIFSHNILAILFFFFALCYMFFLIISEQNKKRSLSSVCLITMVALGISAIFWMPAILERDFVNGLQIYNIESNFPEIYQLIFPSWGTGFSAGDLQNQMSFQIGVANFLAIILSVIFLIFDKKKKQKHKLLILLFLAWFVALFILMIKISLPVWRFLPFMNYFQFPWRLLSLEVLIVSFLAGSIFGSSFFSGTKKKIAIASLLIFSAISLGIGYANVAYYHNRDDNYYLRRANFMDGTNTPGNAFNTKWFDQTLTRREEKLEVVKGKAIITDEKINPTSYSFHIKTEKAAEILINLAYFPGWTALVNGEKRELKPNKEGLVSFDLQKGDYVLKLQFEETPVRKNAAAISILSIIFLLTIFLKSLRDIIKR